MRSDVLIKRLFLLTKLIYKPIIMLGAYSIYAMAIGNEHRVYADIHSNSILKAILYMDSLVPFETVFNTMKDNIMNFNHSGVVNTVTLFTVIPFIPMLLGGFFKGLGGLFVNCAPYFFVDWVYKDTGAYAETTLGEGFWTFLFAILIRLFFAWLLYNFSPIILAVSWVWNLIQFLFFWPGRAKKAESYGEV